MVEGDPAPVDERPLSFRERLQFFWFVHQPDRLRVLAFFFILAVALLCGLYIGRISFGGATPLG